MRTNSIIKNIIEENRKSKFAITETSAILEKKLVLFINVHIKIVPIIDFDRMYFHCRHINIKSFQKQIIYLLKFRKNNTWREIRSRVGSIQIINSILLFACKLKEFCHNAKLLY